MLNLSSVAVAVLISAAANIAELVSASAGHMVASFILLHPVAALSAALRANSARPFFQLVILRKNLVVDLICPRLESCLAFSFLDFLTGLLHMVDHVAFEAVFDSTKRAVVVSLVLILFDEQVVASLSWALLHASALISDLFPLKFLATLHLLWGKQLAQVRKRNRLPAAWIWAQNRKLLIFNAG